MIFVAAITFRTGERTGEIKYRFAVVENLKIACFPFAHSVAGIRVVNRDATNANVGGPLQPGPARPNASAKTAKRRTGQKVATEIRGRFAILEPRFLQTFCASRSATE